MSRTAGAVIVLVLLAAACSRGGDDSAEFDITDLLPPPAPETTAAPGAEPTSAPVVPGTSPQPESGSDDTAVNRLVILDEVGNVVALDPDGANRTVVADATAEGVTFFQPIWSPVDGQIAWSSVGASNASLELAAYDGAGRRRTGMIAAPFYLYWAPDGSTIAVLHNAAEGVEFEMVQTERATTLLRAGGTPFYFTWSPDGHDLAAHVGGVGFIRIGTDGTTSDLGTTSTQYQSPHWVPGGIIHLDQGRLVLTAGSGGPQILASVPGPASFVADPTGSRVAIQAFADDVPALDVALAEAPDVPPDAVYVLDIESGQLMEATTEASIGFFWSPDGEKLLIFAPTAEPGAVDLVVWADGAAETIGSFQPSASFIQTVLPFFPQYAQSYRLWSPDSRSFALVGGAGDTQGIWIHSIDGGPPVFVAEGTWVAWSHD